MKKKLLLLFFFFLSVSAFSQADVVVTNTDFSDYYIPGTNNIYTVTVTNLGPNPATTVHVTSAIPAGITYYSWWGSNGTIGVNDPLDDTITTLAVGATVSYTIEIEVPAAFFGPLTTLVNVTTATVDPNPACTSCSDTDIKALGADLEVINTNNQTQYIPGSTVTYTVTVLNNGPKTAANINVTNPIPAGITSFSWSGNGASGTDVPLSNTIPALTAGSSVVYTIIMQIPAGFTGNLTSVANATTPTIDPVPGCPQCSDTDTQGFGADLEIVNTDGQTTYVSGTTNVYTVTVTNNGPDVATNVHVTNAIPAGIPAGNFNWSGSNGSSGTGTALDDTVATIAVGQTITYTISVDIPAAMTTPLTSQTVVTSTSTDPTPACAQCSDTDTNTFGADIQVTNTDDNATYVVGTNNIYTITVFNNGPLNATNVHVVDVIPAGITAFSWTGSNGSSGTNADLDDTIATLNAGQTVTYTITLGVPAGFTGSLTNSVTVTSPTPDPNPGCTQCDDTDVQAVAGADLVIVKTDGSNTFTPGTQTVYTISVTNNGPDVADNVTVADAVPAGIPAANVSWTGPNGNGTGAISENFATVAVGQTINYTVTVTIPANYDQTSDLVNTVNVTSDTVDPNPDCPRCTDTDTPAPSANLVTLKSDSHATFLNDTEWTYNITLVNVGPSDAVNVNVTDPMPAGITEMEWAGSNGSHGTGSLQDLIASVPAGQVITYQITITIPQNYDLSHANLVNTVSVTSDTPDPSPACPQCTDSDTPAPNWVTVNTSTYELDELVEDVLIHSDCANVSNFSSQGYVSNTSPANATSCVGYFHKNNSDFPIKDGVIIGTAQAFGFQGQYSGGNGTPGTGWATNDTDLQNVSNANGGTSQLHDVAYVQFDFTPLTDQFSFKFLFASEEYGPFQCTYGDVFAFLLTDLDSPLVPGVNPLNVAVIPDVAPPTPVSVLSVRDQAYNGGCLSVNPEWYGIHNANFPAQSAINIRGQLKPMIAGAAVIPNHNYRIKLAIGDYQDDIVNSAVFIEGGSFNVGQANLVGQGFENDSYAEWPDLVGPAAACPGANQVLQAGTSPIAGATYQWYLNDLEIPGETGYTTIADEAGVYSVIVSIGGGCQQTDSITVEFLEEEPFGHPTELFGCEGQPIDLTQINDEILNGLPANAYSIQFHYTQQQAFDVDSPIDPPTSYSGINGDNNYAGEVIYAGIESLFGAPCIAVRSFVLQTYPCGNPVTPPDMYLCDTNADGVEDFDISGVPAIALGANSTADYTLTIHLSQNDADIDFGAIDPTLPFSGFDGQILYVRMETVPDPTVYETTFFTLHLIPIPATPVVSDVTICDEYTLPALPSGSYYNTASGGTGTTLPAGTVITTSTQIWVIAQSSTTPNCTSEASFNVIIVPSPATPVVSDVTACDSYTLPVLPSGSTYNTQSGGTGTTLADGSVISSDQTIWVIAESGTTPNCVSEASFDVTINPTPPVPPVSDVTVCDSYVLPALASPNCSYNTQSGGAGTTLAAGSTVSVTQDIWVYCETGSTPNCSSEDMFTVTVNPTPPTPVVSDVTACDSYTLPVLPSGSTYNTQSGGTGTTLADGSVISSDQTIWVIAESGTTPNCVSEASFDVTINPTPPVPPVSDVTVCDSYVLPALASPNCSYNTQSGGAGTTLAAGSTVSVTQDIWVYCETGSTPNCSSEDMFTVTVNPTPPTPVVSDVTACDSYTLPVLPSGSTYNTQSGGTGTTLADGSVISSDQTIWVIAESGTTPNCVSEASFDVTINPTPPVPPVSDVTVCDSYVLPALASPNCSYNTQSGGAGTTLAAGSTVSVTQDIWVYCETGSTPNCSSEDMFTVTVNPTPVADAPADVSACQQYVLPALAVGNYYDAAGGTGNMLAAGTVITSSQTLYVYAETATTPNCSNENSFDIEIIAPPTPVVPSDLRLCDDNADGFQCFDLTASAGQVTGGDPDLSVRFYLTATDAATGSANFIADPSSYCTIVPGHQTLYIREWNVNAPSCAAVTTLELYVDPRPFALPDIPDYRLCDVNAPSGSEEFTLSSHIPYIVSDPTGLTVSFHASQADALLGTPSLPDLYTSSGEVVWVRLENAAGCVDVASFPLVVDALPVVATPLAPRTECIDTATGLASFNLASYINGISQGIPGVSVSFYASQADADVPQSPLPSPYQSAGGTVIVRLDNAECHVTAPLQLVGAVGPAVTAPSPIAVCDDNNDCFSTFDLTQAEQEIWGGPVPPGVAFAYYLTATDAQQQSANAIASPAAYANIVPCSQTLYVSVTDGAGTCPSVVPLEIQVIPIPEADEDVDPYALCDDDGDGQAYFDLTTLDGQVLGGMDASTHTVSYYATFADIAAGNPIVGVAAYLSPTATIWAVVGSTLTPCTDAVEIELVVDPQPSVSPIPAYRLCDDDFDQHASFDLDGYVGTILGGQTGLTVSFYHTQAEALSGTVGALSSPHVNEPAGSEFIWVRVENSLGCATVTGMDIVVDPLPVPYPVPADSPLLNACDVNTDGIATFDLAAIADFMQENVPATQMVIGFYLTALDAQLDQSPITGPSYTNVVPYTQTIYAGVHNPGTPGDCRSVWPVTLNVLPSAQPAGPLGPLTVCDGDQDGLAVFDLTGHEAEILAAQVGAGPYTVSYYTSQAAAGIGSPSILNPLAYANTSNPQQIWYRVEQPSGDCAATGSFLIQVDLPLALPASLPGIWSVCAPAAGVQSVEWDLTLIQAEIPGLTAGYAVEYYTTLADAQSGSGVNQILTPQAYTNVQNPQNIFLSVRDLATGCIAATYKDIQVIPLPEPRALQPSMALLVECEQNNGGTAFFDLSANQAYMANGSTDMAFEYYDNLADAQAGNSANAIPAADLSVYESAGGVVYIRVERNPGNTDVDGEYCYVIVEITLQVNPQPVLATGVALNRCELAGASTASFDLTEANAPLVAPAAASGYSFSYLDGTTPIPAASATAYTNTSNPQVVTVVVRDLATGCESTGSFTLNVKAGATAQPYAFAPVCDTDTDGLSVVDLTQADATVLGGQAPPQFGVAYYASLADVASGTPIADPSSFTTGTATVYAVVSNYGTGATPDPDPCTSGPQPVTITVEPLVAVSVSSPDDTICIDYATGAVLGAPTLTATPSDAASYTYQWLLDGVDTGVSTPTILADLPGTYTVNVQSLSAAGCVSGPSAGFQVVESSAPEFLAQAYTVTNAFQDHQSVQVHVQGQNAQLFEYSLDGGPWLANGGLFQDVAPGEHTVLVRSACSTTDPLTVILINYPHYFTPNGDGYHDTWNTLGLANDGMTKIYIFDRYGKLIKQIAPEIHGYDGWDGTYNGSPMPSTDYWFLVEYPDPETGTIKEFRAHFSLKR